MARGQLPTPYTPSPLCPPGPLPQPGLRSEALAPSQRSVLLQSGPDVVPCADLVVAANSSDLATGAETLTCVLPPLSASSSWVAWLTVQPYGAG